MVDENGRPNALDAYWMPFTANRAFKARPRVIVAADGVHYTRDDGGLLLDGTSGLYCVNAGHNRRPIAEAIKAQADRLDFAPPFQFGQPQAFELANRIALLAPGDLDHVFLGNSGSDAIETAMKIALSYHRARGEGQRTRFIGRERAYHGVGFGGISVGGIPANRRAFGPVLLPADHLRSTYDRERQAFSIGEPEWGAEFADELERLVALHDASNIAAVIVEPVAGSTGCLPPPKGYLQRLMAIARAHGLLVIFDEVITAFGRLGHAFAAERYGLVPDMITFAKGVTNGVVPMSGVLVRAPLYQTIVHGAGSVGSSTPHHLPEFFHGYTYSGHPLATAAALATLNVYRDDDLFMRTRTREAAFAARMMSLRKLPNVLDIRPIGFMCGIDLAGDGVAGRRGARAMETAFHDVGLYVRVVMDTLVIAPPLSASDAELDQIAEATADTIRRVA